MRLSDRPSDIGTMTPARSRPIAPSPPSGGFLPEVINNDPPAGLFGWPVWCPRGIAAVQTGSTGIQSGTYFREESVDE